MKNYHIEDLIPNEYYKITYIPPNNERFSAICIMLKVEGSSEMWFENVHMLYVDYTKSGWGAYKINRRYIVGKPCLDYCQFEKFNISKRPEYLL